MSVESPIEQSVLELAMTTAVQTGLLRKESDLETYEKNWESMMHVLEAVSPKLSQESAIVSVSIADVWGANARVVGYFPSRNEAKEQLLNHYHITDYHMPDERELHINEGCKSHLYGEAVFFIDTVECGWL